MKCNRCGDFAETVNDVRNCKNGCQQDGTAAQIPALLDGEAAIGAAIACCQGLANRFVPGSAPVQADIVDPPTSQPEPVAKAPKKSTVAKVKDAVTKAVKRVTKRTTH